MIQVNRSRVNSTARRKQFAAHVKEKWTQVTSALTRCWKTACCRRWKKRLCSVHPHPWPARGKWEKGQLMNTPNNKTWQGISTWGLGVGCCIHTCDLNQTWIKSLTSPKCTICLLHFQTTALCFGQQMTQSGKQPEPGLNQMPDVIIAPNLPPACCTSRPQLCVSGSRWYTVCEPCSTLLQSQAECSSYPSQDVQTVNAPSHAQPEVSAGVNVLPDIRWHDLQLLPISQMNTIRSLDWIQTFNAFYLRGKIPEWSSMVGLCSLQDDSWKETVPAVGNSLATKWFIFFFSPSFYLWFLFLKLFFRKQKTKKERQRLSNVRSFQIQAFQKIFLSHSLNLALFSCATQNPKWKSISPPHMKVYLTIQNPNWKFTVPSKIKIYPTNQKKKVYLTTKNPYWTFTSPPPKHLFHHQKSYSTNQNKSLSHHPKTKVYPTNTIPNQLFLSPPNLK